MERSTIMGRTGAHNSPMEGERLRGHLAHCTASKTTSELTGNNALSGNLVVHGILDNCRQLCGQWLHRAARRVPPCLTALKVSFCRTCSFGALQRSVIVRA